jgi:hypothetical protein
MAAPTSPNYLREELPKSMRAVAADGFEPPSVPTLHELSVPKSGPHEVLIPLVPQASAVARLHTRWIVAHRVKARVVAGRGG